MDPPTVRYARAADGSALAWVRFGEGPPQIYVSPVPWSHVTAFWRIPGYAEMYEAIAARRSLIMYDARGTGLSERKQADFSLETRVADLEAVADAAGLETLDLAAAAMDAGVAAAFAARNRGRVQHLLLLDPVARGKDYLEQPAIRALASYREMLEEDWPGYLATLSARIAGFENTARARALAGVLAEAASPESLRAYLASLPSFDASASLEHVSCPTLVLCFPAQTATFPALAREFSTKIPGARTATINSPYRFPLSEEAIAVMEAFLSEPGRP